MYNELQGKVNLQVVNRFQPFEFPIKCLNHFIEPGKHLLQREWMTQFIKENGVAFNF